MYQQTPDAGIKNDAVALSGSMSGIFTGILYNNYLKAILLI